LDNNLLACIKPHPRDLKAITHAHTHTCARTRTRNESRRYFRKSRRKEIRADPEIYAVFIGGFLLPDDAAREAGLEDVLTRAATSPGSPTHKRNASLTPVMELPSFLPISLGP